HFKKADTLVRKTVAVEQIDQLHGPPHIAPAIENEQQIGRGVGKKGAVFTQELTQYFGEFIYRHIFQEHQIQHDLVVFRDVLRVHLRTQRHLGRVLERYDAVDLALLNHGGAVDAQDQIQQAARVQVGGAAVGIQHHAAAHRG